MIQPELVWPAASTFGNNLSRAGLTSPQKKRKRTTPCSEPFSRVTGPNQLWCMDFKGYFTTGGLLGLSKLSLGWMKLGIVHERIQAGRP